MAHIDEIVEKAFQRRSSSEVARLLEWYDFPPEEARAQGRAFALWVLAERERTRKDYDKKKYPRRKRTAEEREILKAARAIVREAEKERKNAGGGNKARRRKRSAPSGI